MPIPLVPGVIASSIMGVSTSKTPHMANIAAAIDVSVNEWLRSSCTVQGSGAGVAASGQGAGILTVLPNPGFMESAYMLYRGQVRSWEWDCLRVVLWGM